MEENRRTRNLRSVFEKSNMEPSSSLGTPPKVKRSRTQSKVSGSEQKGGLRSKGWIIESESRAFKRAKEVEANLSNKFSSFVKYLFRSYTSGPLQIPKQFCEANLPKDDTIIVLEDENGREYKTKYLVKRLSLSGGWKGFCNAQQLREGDVLVFHLILPSKFKVYIIRSCESNEVDVAHDLPHLHSGTKQEQDCVVPQEKLPGTSTKTRDVSTPASDQQPENSHNVGCTVLDWNVSFENFKIVVDGKVLDSRVPKRLKARYYDLCQSQRMYLHEDLQGRDCDLVVGLISVMVDIATGIRNCNITTSSECFESWNKSVRGLERAGMKVSFLLIRLEKLKNLASMFQRYSEIRSKRDQAEEGKKILEQEREKLKILIAWLDVELENRNFKRLDLEARFLDLFNSPW